MSRAYRASIIGLLLFAVAVRGVEVWHPVDGRSTAPTREADVAGMARNFYRESMNLFLPRIDWRGDGPGYVESEFPIYPWTGAVLYHLFGDHEALLRLLSLGCSLASLAVFVMLIKHRLPPAGVLAALLVYAVNPLDIRLATAIQPEPLMALLYLCAAVAFLRWTESEQRRDFYCALAATTAAILAKLPAAHIGVFFAGLCLTKFGWRAILRRDLWVFIVVSLGLPLLWYAHARSLYLEYGNSLGISNEAYVRISSMSFLEAFRITSNGNLRTELDWVWTLPGAIVGLIGFVVALKTPSQRWMALWLTAVGLFYVVAGRTTGEEWAAYYHIVSVPVAALLIGNGVAAVIHVPWVTLFRPDDGSSPSIQWTRRRHVATASVLCALLGLTIIEHARRVRWNMADERAAPLFRTAVTLRERMRPDEALLIASGGSEVDQFGLQRAANSSYYFFWTGRKGFTLHGSDQSLEKLEEFRRRGATYFIAERHSLADDPGFEQTLRQHFRVRAEGEHAILFDLRDDITNTSQRQTEDGDDA